MIHSVLKAIDILEVFSPDEPRLTLAEISERMELPKSTTHNLLNTLASRRYVEKREDGRYALGPAIIALTQAVRINVELRDVAAPLLRALAEACRESVYLTVLDGDYALYIYAVESSDRLRARSAVGDRVHLHCTSVGKAILSALEPEEVTAILARAGMPRFTDSTIVEPARLLRELRASAARGYAIDRSEHEANYYCIGAPIFDRRGRVIAACSVSGSNPEILGARLPDLSSRVVYAAQEISRYMGRLPARGAAIGNSAAPGDGF
jgi:DNA-binding IclR family transcriptional regulator